MAARKTNATIAREAMVLFPNVAGENAHVLSAAIDGCVSDDTSRITFVPSILPDASRRAPSTTAPQATLFVG